MMCTVRTTVINQYYLYLKHVLLNNCFISLFKTGVITLKMTSSLQYTIERNGKILTLLFSTCFVLFIVLLSLLILRLSHINLVVEYTPQKLHMYSPSLYRSNQLKNIVQQQNTVNIIILTISQHHYNNSKSGQGRKTRHHFGLNPLPDTD